MEQPTRLYLGYNSHVTINIAELKNRLSAYIQQVRAGQEIVVRDRNLPVAKLVPFRAPDTSAEELGLAASGELRLPEETLDEAAFWAIGSDEVSSEAVAEALSRAISQDREERDDSVLGL